VRDGEQLDLWPLEVARIPWYGTSPRGLTKVQTALFSKRKRPGPRAELDPLQLDLFGRLRRATRKKGRSRRSRPAPLLLPFEEGGL